MKRDRDPQAARMKPNRARCQALAARDAFVMPRSVPQNLSRLRGLKDRVHKGFGFAGRKRQKSAPFDGLFCRRFRAMQNEIRHGAPFDIRCALDKELLLLVEASVETVDLWIRLFSTVSFGGGDARHVAPASLYG